jgi:hypothetical protein
MAFILNTRLLGVKTEATPYTGETLASADYNVRFYDVEFNTDVSNHKVKALLGNMMTIVDVKGRRMGTATFSFDLVPHADADTAPNYAKILTACGMIQTIHTGTGISWSQGVSNLCKPVTIEHRLLTCDNGTQKVQKITGATGTAVFSLDENSGRLKVNCTFMGALEDETDTATIISGLTGLNTEEPRSFAQYTATFGGDARTIDGFEFDIGNTNNMITDNAKASGYRGSFIGDQEPKVTFSPLMQTNSEEATLKIFASYITGTEGILEIAKAPATGYVGQKFTFNKAQVETAPNGERENLVTREVSFGVFHNPSGVAWEYVQGAKA